MLSHAWKALRGLKYLKISYCNLDWFSLLWEYFATGLKIQLQAPKLDNLTVNRPQIEMKPQSDSRNFRLFCADWVVSSCLVQSRLNESISDFLCVTFANSNFRNEEWQRRINHSARNWWNLPRIDCTRQKIIENQAAAPLWNIWYNLELMENRDHTIKAKALCRCSLKHRASLYSKGLSGG